MRERERESKNRAKPIVSGLREICVQAVLDTCFILLFQHISCTLSRDLLRCVEKKWAGNSG